MTEASITGDLFHESTALDQLLRDARLYRTSAEYMALLDFVNRLPHIAPFNAMLLQIQKPGLKHAAHASDWAKRFGRTIKEDARPLLILWPFGPVSLVYDVVDTEGPELAVDVFSFVAWGAMDRARVDAVFARLARQNIHCVFKDAGDADAGSISCMFRADPKDKESRSTYLMKVNRNHTPNTQFATIAHELAHLHLGHLGEDRDKGIKSRTDQHHDIREIEAESVSYLVCARNKVESRTQPYISLHFSQNLPIPEIDVYSVMRAAGAVEQAMRP